MNMVYFAGRIGQNPFTSVGYVQAPPFFDAIVTAISKDRLNVDQKFFEEDDRNPANELDRDGHGLSSLEALCGPEWYNTVFLSRVKFSRSDEEVLERAFESECFLETFEIDRFDYERLINDGDEFVSRLSSLTPSGPEMKRRLPKAFKGSLESLTHVLKMLPDEGQLILSAGVLQSTPKEDLYRVMRWIQAFPPLHREIVDGVTVICAVENCENAPFRIPGIGFQFMNRERFAEEDADYSSPMITISKDVRIEWVTPAEKNGNKFTVLANGKAAQEGNVPKVDVNFATKRLRIESNNKFLEITRSVKTLALAHGSIEFKSQSSAPATRLDAQISRAWWFDRHSLLIFSTQSNQLYSWKNDQVTRLGEIPFDNYGIDCSVNDLFSKVVVSSRGADFIEFKLEGDHRPTFKTLGSVPYAIWGSILSTQYKPAIEVARGLVSAELPDTLAATALFGLRWFEFKHEMAMMKAGIATVGDLLSLTPAELKEKVSLRSLDLERLEWEIEQFLRDTLVDDAAGVIQERIWLGLNERGWVTELGEDDTYELPKITDERALRGVQLENEITSVEFEGESVVLTLGIGIKVVLSESLDLDALRVPPWQPNRFKQRRFNSEKLELASESKGRRRKSKR